MEKLQVAIEHARKRRGLETVGNAVRAPTVPSDPAQEDVWAVLKQFEPKHRHLLSNRVMTEPDISGARGAVDMLRTRLLKMMRENDWWRVMVTSPTSRCGKSTLTANLAFAFQRQKDIKTLLLDLDLQRAELGPKLGLFPEKGIVDYLLGEVSATEQFHRIEDNLAVSVGGRKKRRSPDLLKTAGAQRRIDEAETLLAPDLVLIDVPPIFESDDTIAVAGLVDCAIIVGAADESTVSDLEEVERDLAQYTNIAGIVLNKCRIESKAYGYEYDNR